MFLLPLNIPSAYSRWWLKNSKLQVTNPLYHPQSYKSMKVPVSWLWLPNLPSLTQNETLTWRSWIQWPVLKIVVGRRKKINHLWFSVGSKELQNNCAPKVFFWKAVCLMLLQHQCLNSNAKNTIPATFLRNFPWGNWKLETMFFFFFFFNKKENDMEVDFQTWQSHWD